MIGYQLCTPDELPDVAALLLSVLLARIGGQTALTQDELCNVAASYVGLRITYDTAGQTVLLTLQTTLETPPGAVLL